MASQPNFAPDCLESELLALIRERVLETQPGFDPDSNLYESGLDSMALMQLLMLVEDRYALAIAEADLTHRNFSSVRHLAALIRERRTPAG